MASLKSVRYATGCMSVIDQLKLPNEFTYIDINTAEDAWSVIRKMQVRGAPLIAIVAALGLAVDVYKTKDVYKTVDEVVDFLLKKMDYLRTSRPTAVHLFNAMDDLSEYVKSMGLDAAGNPMHVIDSYVAKAADMLREDLDANRTLAAYGADHIMSVIPRKTARVLTICNTGSLATAGHGTALGVIRTLHERGQLEHVYACETRPYNQGARLTAFEIVQDELPGTLIPDSAASALMLVKGVDCVVVGADRVVSNGDTANKVGTYQLAIAAHYHRIPFFVALASSTIDTNLATGSDIHVEERPSVEMTSLFGHKIAPDGVNAWNPSFDVTPNGLISGVITELGVAVHSAGEANVAHGAPVNCAPWVPDCENVIDMVKFLSTHGVDRVDPLAPSKTPLGYRRMTTETIPEYVSKNARFCDLLDIDGTNPTEVSSLNVLEVGDGNLNFVFLVHSKKGNSIVIKQALPYVRCVGENWPLTLDRASYEMKALFAEHSFCPDLVPEVYHFDATLFIIVMEFIPPPHIILRKSLIQQQKLASVAPHLGTFLAKTLFGSSLLSMTGKQFRNQVSAWSSNMSMCALTEQVIFTDPYYEAEHNHWTKSDKMDTLIHSIWTNLPLKLAITSLKEKFLCKPQALLHADLHTGSIMVASDSTKVIDPEFGFVGPMGFDIGLLIANYFFSYFAHQSAVVLADSKVSDFGEWVLQQVDVFHGNFLSEFTELWTQSAAAATSSSEGELYRSSLFSKATNEASSSSLAEAQSGFLNDVWKDTVGFAGAEMIRRVVGIAHVEDFEGISLESPGGPARRLQGEHQCVTAGMAMVLYSVGATNVPLNNMSELMHYVRSMAAMRV